MHLSQILKMMAEGDHRPVEEVGWWMKLASTYRLCGELLATYFFLRCCLSHSLGLQVAREAGFIATSHHTDQDVEEVCRHLFKRYPEEVTGLVTWWSRGRDHVICTWHPCDAHVIDCSTVAFQMERWKEVTAGIFHWRSDERNKQNCAATKSHRNTSKFNWLASLLDAIFN